MYECKQKYTAGKLLLARKLNSAADIVGRLKVGLGLKSNRALAALLGVEPSTVTNWKSRNKVDADLVIRAARTKQLSLDWLFDGIGPMRVGTTELSTTFQPAVHESEALYDDDDVHEALTALFQLPTDLESTDERNANAQRILSAARELARRGQQIADAQRRFADMIEDAVTAR